MSDKTKGFAIAGLVLAVVGTFLTVSDEIQFFNQAYTRNIASLNHVENALNSLEPNAQFGEKFLGSDQVGFRELIDIINQRLANIDKNKVRGITCRKELTVPFMGKELKLLNTYFLDLGNAQYIVLGFNNLLRDWANESRKESFLIKGLVLIMLGFILSLLQYVSWKGLNKRLLPIMGVFLYLTIVLMIFKMIPAGHIASAIQLISIFTLGGLAIFAEPIRHFLFKANLELNFGNTSDFVALTPERTLVDYVALENNAYYIRVKVTNTNNIAAKECRAYLINIEKKDGIGKFQPSIYCDSIPLAWSCQNIGEQYNGININKGVNQYFDVLATRHEYTAAEKMYPPPKASSSGADILYPQMKLQPYRYEGIFKEKGTFRFSVQVTAANADPKTIQLILEWNGLWDKFKVRTDTLQLIPMSHPRSHVGQ